MLRRGFPALLVILSVARDTLWGRGREGGCPPFCFRLPTPPLGSTTPRVYALASQIGVSGGRTSSALLEVVCWLHLTPDDFRRVSSYKSSSSLHKPGSFEHLLMHQTLSRIGGRSTLHPSPSLVARLSPFSSALLLLRFPWLLLHFPWLLLHSIAVGTS